MDSKKSSANGQSQRRKIKKIRRELTLRGKIDKALGQVFGGRSIGNVGATILLVVSIFLGIWVTIYSAL